MKSLYLSLFFFIVLGASAQDINGIWRGYFNQVVYTRDAEGRKLAIPQERYKFEVQLDDGLKNVKAVTYSYLNTVFYGKASAVANYNLKTGKLLLEELKLVEVKMNGLDETCIMTCFLQYSKSGNEEFLEGTYMSMNTKDSSDCGKGKVFLRKVTTTDFYKEPFLVKKEKPAAPKPQESAKTDKKPAVAPKPALPLASLPPVQETIEKTPPSSKINPTEIGKVTESKKGVLEELPIPKVLIARSNEVIKNLEINETQVTVKIFDNGTIDNDTVSVYLDKKLVISRQRLTAKPLTLSFEMSSEQKEHELVLVAENLGEIPPNTSLMVIQTPTKEYEVHVSSNEQKNAVIKFKFGKTP